MTTPTPEPLPAPEPVRAPVAEPAPEPVPSAEPAPSIIPTDEPQPGSPMPGDWIKVWGQVVTDSARPEDIVVRLESKSDQFEVSVRRDRTEAAETLPDFVPQCNDLSQTSPNMLVRCTLHHGHHMDEGHLGPNGERWSKDVTIGHFEEA